MTTDISVNLRRLMAKFNMTAKDVSEACDIDLRTVSALTTGKNSKPHARTLYKLASGLGIATDELFQNPSVIGHRLVDRKTNPVVETVIEEHPLLFDGWSEEEFDELYSRVGTGGALTHEGARRAAEEMNNKREVHYRVDLLLESTHADVLTGFIDLLYQNTVVELDES